MIRFFNGEGRQTTAEEIMNHINLHLKGRSGGSGEPDRMALQKHLEEIRECIGQMEEEFDLLRAVPDPGSGIKGRVKAVVAKCVGWYMKDIHRQQTSFNLHMLSALQSEAAILEVLAHQKAKESEGEG